MRNTTERRLLPRQDVMRYWQNVLAVRNVKGFAVAFNGNPKTCEGKPAVLYGVDEGVRTQRLPRHEIQLPWAPIHIIELDRFLTH